MRVEDLLSKCSSQRRLSSSCAETASEFTDAASLVERTGAGGVKGSGETMRNAGWQRRKHEASDGRELQVTEVSKKKRPEDNKLKRARLQLGQPQTTHQTRSTLRPTHPHPLPHPSPTSGTIRSYHIIVITILEKKVSRLGKAGDRGVGVERLVFPASPRARSLVTILGRDASLHWDVG